MSQIVSENLFFLPLRASVWGLSPEGSDRAIDDWFIADQSNEALQIFTDLNSFDPLFFPVVLYGPSGAGKTSLAIALGERFARLGSESPLDGTCGHLSAVDFARGLAEAIHTKSVDAFYERLLSFRALVIDNLDALSHYPNALLDFCSFLDRLSELRIPCVVTCQTRPEHAAGIPESISSRLASGFAVPVRLPGINARRQLIRLLLEKHSLPLDVIEIDSLAYSNALSLPQLNRLVAELKNNLAMPSGSEGLVASLASSSDSHRIDEDSASALLDLAVAVVAEHFNLHPAALLSPSRKHTTVLARSIAVFLSRRLFSLNYSVIGKYFGGRDHSTILHSYRKISELYQADSAFLQIVDSLWAKCALLRSQQCSSRGATLKTC